MASRTRLDLRLPLGCGIGVLATFGLWTTIRAIRLLARGGDPSFDGVFQYPPWMLAHFVAATLFVVVVPLQLIGPLRRAYPAIHWFGGWLAGSSGVVAATTGMALPFAMPTRPFAERAFMVIVGVAIVLMLARGIGAIRRRDVATHRRWMLRVAALGLAPMTERVIFPAFAALGIQSLDRFWDLFTTALWVSAAINVVFAEWWIQRDARPRPAARAVVERLAS